MRPESGRRGYGNSIRHKLAIASKGYVQDPMGRYSRVVAVAWACCAHMTCNFKFGMQDMQIANPVATHVVRRDGLHWRGDAMLVFPTPYLPPCPSPLSTHTHTHTHKHPDPSPPTLPHPWPLTHIAKQLQPLRWPRYAGAPDIILEYGHEAKPSILRQ